MVEEVSKEIGLSDILFAYIFLFGHQMCVKESKSYNSAQSSLPDAPTTRLTGKSFGLQVVNLNSTTL